jgi:hypothetical protein
MAVQVVELVMPMGARCWYVGAIVGEQSVRGRSWLLAGIILVVCGPVRAEDLDAGKSGAKIFETDCSTCHRTPRGIARGKSARALADFLRAHYTTGRGPASSVAEYLVSVGGRQGRPAAAGAEPAPRSADKPARQIAPDRAVGAQGVRNHRRAAPDHATAPGSEEPGVLGGTTRDLRWRQARPTEQADQARPTTENGGTGSDAAGLQPVGAVPDTPGQDVNREDRSTLLPGRGPRVADRPQPAGALGAVDRGREPTSPGDATRNLTQPRPSEASRAPESDISSIENAAATAAQFPEPSGSAAPAPDQISAAPSAPGDQASFSAPLP